MIEKYVFYFLTAILLVSAIGVVTLRNIFHCALLLGLSLFSIAGLYLLMGSEFLAAVQVLVYVGGILVLILFVIMLTKKIYDKDVLQSNEQKAPALLVSISIFAIMLYGILKTSFPDYAGPGQISYAATVGKALFSRNILPFEIVSIILLIALVGAIILARKEQK